MNIPGRGPLQTLRFLFWYEIQNGGYNRTCLILDPLGKMFQNASSLKPNCPGMIIGRSSVFYVDRKSKMAATTGHSINTGRYGENTEIYSSLKLLHWLNLNCASIIGRSFTHFVFFMLIVEGDYILCTSDWRHVIFAVHSPMSHYCALSRIQMIWHHDKVVR
jgi:hypothetical protein